LTCEDVEPVDKPIALIPAKGYSERLSQKNLRLLGGKPLVQWLRGEDGAGGDRMEAEVLGGTLDR